MSRRFTIVALVLTAVVAFLVGAIVAGGLPRASVVAGAGAKSVSGRPVARTPSYSPDLEQRQLKTVRMEDR